MMGDKSKIQDKNHPSAQSPVMKQLSQMLARLEIRSDMNIISEEGDLVSMQAISELQDDDTFNLYIKLSTRQMDMDISEDILQKEIETFRKALDDEDWHIRISAIQTLSQLGGSEAIALIQKAQEDPEPYVKQSAQNALKRANTGSISQKALPGISLVLNRHKENLISFWRQMTNSRGQVLFTELPSDGIYKAYPHKNYGFSIETVPISERQVKMVASPLEAKKHESMAKVFNSEDGSLFCTIREVEPRNQTEILFESGEENFDGALVRFDFVSEEKQHIVLSGIVLLHSIKGVYTGRYYVQEPFECKCNINFGIIEPESLTSFDSQVIVNSYNSTDNRSKSAWRDWLKRKEQLRLHSGFRGIYEVLDAERK